VVNNLDMGLRFRWIAFSPVADEPAGTEDSHDIINQSIAANVRRAVLSRFTLAPNHTQRAAYESAGPSPQPQDGSYQEHLRI
jgi:hypothetical protein